MRRPPGAALVLYAALSFAAANAFAKALYLRGCTLVSVFLVRCLVVYLWNGALTAVREGCPTSCRVLTLRTGRIASNRMALTRGFVGAMTGIGLNLSFVFLTFADGFTVFKGCALLGSAVGAGFLGERLNWRELCILLSTCVGLVFVAQPPLIFGAATHRRALAAWSTGERAAGIGAATFSGLCDAGFTLLTRQLSREGRPLGAVSPALLLSYFMAATFGCVLVVGVAATATGLYLSDGFGWARLQGVTRHTPEPWDLGEPPLLLLALLLLYCVGILSGQLAMARGMATTRAGVGAILQVSEIAFAFVLDVVFLGERTNALAAGGTAIVFCSVSALACAKAPRRPTQTLAAADAAREQELPAAAKPPAEGSAPPTPVSSAQTPPVEGAAA